MAAAAPKPRRVNIKIVSDNRRLEKALKVVRTTLGVEADVEWLPFFLDERLPQEGVSKLEHYNRKFGAHRVRAMIPRMKAVGQEVGINFSYGGKIGNTMDSHRMIEMAKKVGKQDAVVEQLMHHYFELEHSLSDRSVLLEVAEATGLEGVGDMLDSDAGKREVSAMVRHVRSAYGVTGVPFFVVGDTFSFSGAQESDTIVDVIKQVIKKQDDEAAKSQGESKM